MSNEQSANVEAGTPADPVKICGRHSSESVREHIGRLVWRRTEMRYDCDLCPFLALGEAERRNAADCFDVCEDL